MKIHEGFIQTKGGKVWYKIVGNNKNAIPLITVHGGPGFPHDYLEPLEELANERQIIFYDQLGCGNSEKNNDKSFWTVDYFVSELETLVKELKLPKYNLLGQSWGCTIAVALTRTKAQGLQNLILSNPYISTPLWQKDAILLLKKLPEKTQLILKKGDLESMEYKKAEEEYYSSFVWRMDSLPVAIQKSQNKFNFELYKYMFGTSEFNSTGTLKNYDLTAILPKINLPSLLLCGRFDTATPETVKYFHGIIPNSEFKVFEKSAHVPFWNEREEYINSVRKFLQTV